MCVCVCAGGGAPLHDVEVAQCETKKHTQKLGNTPKSCVRRQADTHSAHHKTFSFIGSSWENGHIKGGVWSRAAVLWSRSAPDVFQSI